MLQLQVYVAAIAHFQIWGSPFPPSNSPPSLPPPQVYVLTIPNLLHDAKSLLPIFTKFKRMQHERNAEEAAPVSEITEMSSEMSLIPKVCFASFFCYDNL